ncbi:MAG: helix-turn-helix domain-containing protein [Acidimicrobiia bacterium]
MADELPDLLTMEEAARLARVGRTKAYSMAREWRATGGRSGLPVVDFGHVLRVPRRALEEMIGAKFTNGLRETPVAVKGGSDKPEPEAAAAEPAVSDAAGSSKARPSSTRPKRRGPKTSPGQISLPLID